MSVLHLAMRLYRVSVQASVSCFAGEPVRPPFFLMVFRLFLLLSHLLLLSLGGKPCKGAHDVQCSKNAQTAAAYQGYCKGCFAMLFPKDYERLEALRTGWRGSGSVRVVSYLKI